MSDNGSIDQGPAYWAGSFISIKILQGCKALKASTLVAARKDQVLSRGIQTNRALPDRRFALGTPLGVSLMAFLNFHFNSTCTVPKVGTTLAAAALAMKWLARPVLILRSSPALAPRSTVFLLM